ncbi:interferon lambda-3-like [Equus przewalskii]|uniref:Interferon lambda-3-like n=1 Tax=Equus przewalskii TaxID=9798 RepID=A0ABM4JI43_EQUPR|nr:interferon lambda-3-like [Equus caballus]
MVVAMLRFLCRKSHTTTTADIKAPTRVPEYGIRKRRQQDLVTEHFHTDTIDTLLSFPRAVETKNRDLGALERRECIVSPFWRPEVPIKRGSFLLKNHTCRSRPFPRTWDLRQLQVWERPVALEAELALTLRVLANSSLGDVLDRPLGTLSHIHSELQACVAAQPTAGPRPQGRLLQWLHRLHKAPKKEPWGCLEASVMFNLFRLLTKDLTCVASGDLCV